MVQVVKANTHNVAAGGRADHAGADRLVVFIESTDIAGVFIVIDYFIAVCHDVVSLKYRGLLMF